MLSAFRHPKSYNVPGEFSLRSTTDQVEEEEAKVVDATPTIANPNPEAVKLKEELLSLASSTKRGFSASRSERKKAKDLIYDLAGYNPTKEPAAAFYTDNEAEGVVSGPTLAGKWTLAYTDAPDITTLDAGPLAAAKLGRIGQECSPPFIKNVIEWRRPDWAKSLPLSGTDESRVLQKVCTEAVAAPDNPAVVDLKLVGLDLFGFGGDSSDMKIDEEGKKEERTVADNIREDGIPAGLLESNPVELRGQLKAPFGQFEILYLDEEMRIIKTGQNYLAVNVRDDEEWF